MISPALPTRDQRYAVALTALYLYDYLLTFADEVFFAPDNTSRGTPRPNRVTCRSGMCGEQRRHGVS